MNLNDSLVQLQSGSVADASESLRYTAKLQTFRQLIYNSLVPQQRWEVGFPLPPRCPLLLTHRAVDTAFEFTEHGLGHADLEALETGLMDEVQVVIPALRPWEMRSLCNGAKGALKPEDSALIDVDFDEPPLNQRTAPSLSLLKAPLYTEIGLDPPDVRAERRQRLLEGRSSEILTESHNEIVAPESTESWISATKTTFHNTNALQQQFESVLQTIAVRALSLKPSVTSRALAKLLLSAIGTVCEHRERYLETLAELETNISAMLAQKDHVAKSDSPLLSSWYSTYARLLNQVRDDNASVIGLSSLLDELSRQHQLDASKSATKLALVHPTAKDVVPLSVMPCLPLESTNPEAKVELLVLQGARPVQGGGRAPLLFADGHLLEPEGSRDNALYRSEASTYAPFNEEKNSTRHYVVVLDNDAAYFKPVSQLKEMQRNTGHQGQDDNYGVRFVMWEDRGAKRHRPEVTA